MDIEPSINHPCPGGDVGEGAVAVVMVQKVRGAFEAARPTDLHGLPAERAIEFAALGRVVDIEVDVTTDVEVQVPVIVVVAEGRAAAPDIVAADSGLGGDIRKRSVAIVPVEDVRPEVVNKKIDKPVVIVVGGHGPVSPADSFDACPPRDIGERAVAVVSKQVIAGTISNGGRIEKIGYGGAVDDVQIHIPIVVVIKPHAAASVYFKDILLVPRSADQPGRNTRLSGHVAKGYCGPREGTAG